MISTQLDFVHWMRHKRVSGVEIVRKALRMSMLTLSVRGGDRAQGAAHVDAVCLSVRGGDRGQGAAHVDAVCLSGVEIVRKALRMPMFTIALNAGVDAQEVVSTVMRSDVGVGYDAMTGEYVDMVKSGIIDPTKVRRPALYTFDLPPEPALPLDPPQSLHPQSTPSPPTLPRLVLHVAHTLRLVLPPSSLTPPSPPPHPPYP